MASESPEPNNSSPSHAADSPGAHSPLSDKTPTENHPPLPDEQPPPLPDEQAPPLPEGEAPPPLPQESAPDDGWEPVWDETAQAFYFYNRITKQTQWENPRVPTEKSTVLPPPPTLASLAPPGLGSYDRIGESSSAAHATRSRTTGGYNPAIHGDYDPNADYALGENDSDEEHSNEMADQFSAAAQAALYTATGTFNRFTGKWQNANLNPENFNDENKSARQMSAFFDIDSAMNVHDGRSLKAERQNKKFSRKEIKAFKEKRREKKEEKRRAWLRD
jgi:hypothetical protein